MTYSVILVRQTLKDLILHNTLSWVISDFQLNKFNDLSSCIFHYHLYHYSHYFYRCYYFYYFYYRYYYHYDHHHHYNYYYVKYLAPRASQLRQTAGQKYFKPGSQVALLCMLPDWACT